MNKVRQNTHEWAKTIDAKYADTKTEYGARKEGDKWVVRLWQPVAKKITMSIFDKEDQNKYLREIEGTFVSPNWIWEIEEDVNGFFYQYNITHEDGSKTTAMDPFAKSLAAFNWKGKNDVVGKAAFVDYKAKKKLFKLNKINEPQPIIYEAHVRDLTSQRSDVKIPGSFNALKEIDFGKYLSDLNITHIQFLPIHNCYTLDEMNKTIIGREKGAGWETNYNWGYDPNNYFSINGWYSSKPENPYNRMEEFDELVQHFHKNDIKVICDVVYNHLYDHQTFNNVFPDYYFRIGSDVTPVAQPALASERLMVRKLIIDSLKHFVSTYDVDGFRFDLSTFTDTQTLEEIASELRTLKPNIVLHGEAWKFTDLEHTDSYTKGVTHNNDDFAYFNDTTRNAIKAPDDGSEFFDGLITGCGNKFVDYVSSVVGNLEGFEHDIKDISLEKYDLFANTPNIVLNYAACHDGHTLWDKVNLVIEGDITRKFEAYRQAILMQQLLQGRSLFLEGTELLYTKPHDTSGRGEDRNHTSKFVEDIFKVGTKEFNENSYKTTDYTNGLRWENADKFEIKEHIRDFFAAVNKYRLTTKFFNMSTLEEVNKHYSFNLVDKHKLIIDFNIEINGEKIRVIHNFSKEIYNYEESGKIIFDSNIKVKNTIGAMQPNSTILIACK